MIVPTGGETSSLAKGVARLKSTTTTQGDQVLDMANGISPDELSCGMNVVFGKRAEYSDEHFSARAYKHGNLQLRFKRWGFAAKGECPVFAEHCGGSVIGKGYGSP